MNTTKKNRKPLFIALIVIALIGICVSVYLFVPDTNTAKDAVQLDDASQEGQNAYLDFVGISSCYAQYEGYDKLGLYIAEDRDGLFYVVALENNRLSDYGTQLRFFYYGGDYSTAASARITGQAFKADSEMKKVTMDSMNELFGEKVITSANYEDYMGVYYINTNISATSYGSFLAAVIVMFISLAVLAIGVYNLVSSKNIAEDEKHRYGLATVCGFAGLIIASIIPMVLGMFLNLVSFYAMIAVPFGFIVGYGIIEKRMRLVIKLLYIVASGIMGFVSMWVVYSWVYYKEMSDYIGMSFMQAVATLGENIDKFEEPYKVKMYIVLAAIISFVGAIVMAASFKGKEKKVLNAAGPNYEYMNPEAMNPGNGGGTGQGAAFSSVFNNPEVANNVRNTSPQPNSTSGYESPAPANEESGGNPGDSDSKDLNQ